MSDNEQITVNNYQTCQTITAVARAMMQASCDNNSSDNLSTRITGSHQYLQTDLHRKLLEVLHRFCTTKHTEM